MLHAWVKNIFPIYAHTRLIQMPTLSSSLSLCYLASERRRICVYMGALALFHSRFAEVLMFTLRYNLFTINIVLFFALTHGWRTLFASFLFAKCLFSAREIISRGKLRNQLGVINEQSLSFFVVGEFG